MKDTFGREIHEGDMVVYASKPCSVNLSFGRVTGFSKTGCARIRVCKSNTHRFRWGTWRMGPDGKMGYFDAGKPHTVSVGNESTIAILDDLPVMGWWPEEDDQE